MEKFRERAPLLETPGMQTTPFPAPARDTKPVPQCPFIFSRPPPPMPSVRPPQPPPPPPRLVIPIPPPPVSNGYRPAVPSATSGSLPAQYSPSTNGTNKTTGSECRNGYKWSAQDNVQKRSPAQENRGAKRPLSPEKPLNSERVCDRSQKTNNHLDSRDQRNGVRPGRTDSVLTKNNIRDSQTGGKNSSNINGVDSGKNRPSRADSGLTEGFRRGNGHHLVSRTGSVNCNLRKEDQRTTDTRRDSSVCDNQRNSHVQTRETNLDKYTFRRNEPPETVEFSAPSQPVRYCFLEAREFYRAGGSIVVATSRLEALHEAFRKRVFGIFEDANKKNKKMDEDPSDSEQEDDMGDPGRSGASERLHQRENSRRRKPDPNALNADLMFNAHNMLNDGKACRCSPALREYGIKHGHLVGEEEQKYSCKTLSNNAQELFCYRMVLDPIINFISSHPTKIRHAGRDFSFNGFCILSHQRLNKFPRAFTTRFNVEYIVSLEEITTPCSFVVEDLNIFRRFLFGELMELVDWHLKAENFIKNSEICDVFHFYPVFGRQTDDLMEVAPMSSVLYHILSEFRLLFSESDAELVKCAPDLAFDDRVSACRGGLVAVPGKRPAAFRVDQIDKDTSDILRRDARDKQYPALVHFATRSTSAVDPRTYREQKKLDQIRAVLETRPKSQVTPEDKMRLHNQQRLVDDLMRNSKLKREVTVVLSSRGIYNTGLKSDLAQYGTLIPWVAFHFRYHISLDILEEKLQYKFSDRNLLELALTHPSYRLNVGTNADHIRNIQSNLGFRKAAYGQAGQIPKSGIKTLIHTMAQLGVEDEMASPIKNYERLEFLGDAVLEFLTSLRLFLIFQDIQEGGLATFRATLVQNSHLAVLGETYSLSHYLLISHGRELSSRKRITDKHAAANCFEAVCGAIFLDGGIRYVDEFFGRSLKVRLFSEDEHLAKVWMFPPAHVSMTAYPNGDRHLIPQHELLQRCVKFEELTGIPFTHVRLLANAFSSRQVHDNDITIGNNQRLEFLGDTVLQLIVSDYLFKHFPVHHEGHLSLLRSSLVSNKTQAIVCDEMDMVRYQIRDQGAKGSVVPDIKMKDKADLVEAYLGALYLDKGLTVCHAFCKVVFFPKLTDFISNQSWSDPKSRLQQCCLTLRSIDGSAPKLPEYKVINRVGPSNNRQYEVAVYFNGERLATATASNTKLAEEAAAEAALKNPTFLEDYKRQKSFARRAVAAQKAQAGRFVGRSSRAPELVDRRVRRMGDN